MHKVAGSLLSLPCNIYLFTLISAHASGEVTRVRCLCAKWTIAGVIDNVSSSAQTDIDARAFDISNVIFVRNRVVN